MNAIQQLNESIKREASAFLEIAKETNRVVVGQDRLINRLMIGLLCGGHILIEGVPGLAKTLAVRTLASTVQAKFQRIQFTPDLLPSDLIGTQIYNPRTGEFSPRLGPIFANIVLADEINRAPAKVQSALLEAMEERQVTVGDQTHTLPAPFMVLATQNPIEQEGTYILPEAQLDRFMLKVIVGYPTRAEERVIVERMTTDEDPVAQPVIDLASVQQARMVVNGIYVDEKIHEYILNIIFMSRDPLGSGAKDLGSLIEYGASPRATIALHKAARAYAFLRGRGYVTPDDVKQMAADVLRHRILVTFEAQAENITSNQVIERILSSCAGAVMITADVLRRIQHIELRTRKLVNETFAGTYRSAFQGRGIEFDAIRPYEPGDDVRLIDWNVTARTGDPFVRQYVEERELTVMLLLDISASCLFGSTSKSKRDAAAEVGAVLAYSAIHNNDKVGLVLFSDHTELYVPPRKGRNHILRLIRDLLTVQPSHKQTDIAAALRMANRSLKRRSIIFLLSDMLAPVDSYATDLSLLAYHHEVMVLVFSDPAEQQIPDVGLAKIEDAETGQIMWIDTNTSNWQRNFSTQVKQLQNRVGTAMAQANVDAVHININDDYVARLVSLFQHRASSRR